MSIINDVVMAVMGMAQAAVDGYTLHRGPLLLGPDISMEPDSGGPDERFFSKNCTYSISLTLNGKDESIERITDAMNLIHSRVTRSPWYPSAPKWQILRVGTQNAPVLIERQDDGMWVYGSALSVEFFFRGDD